MRVLSHDFRGNDSPFTFALNANSSMMTRNHLIIVSFVDFVVLLVVRRDFTVWRVDCASEGNLIKFNIINSLNSKDIY